MKDIEAKRWRQAASALGLTLVDAEGRKVSHKYATQEHSMRGSLEGREVVVRYGQRSIDDGITVIEVRTARSLRLGLKIQVSAPPKAPNGRFAGVGHTVISGIEQDRVNSMLSSTASGRACLDAIRALGALGWAQLSDTRLRTQSEIYVEAAEGYVSLIRSAHQAALLAEAAREELEPADWETRLLDGFQTAAGELQLEVLQQGFGIGGLVRRVPVHVTLRVTNRYFVEGKAEFSKPLRTGSLIEPRSSAWSRFAALVGFDRPTSDRTFNMAFNVSRSLRPLLSDGILADILDLSRDGDVLVNETNVTYRTATLTTDLHRLTSQLVRIVERLAPRAEGSPYR